MPEDTLHRARQLVDDIFSRAGVQMDWTGGTEALTVILSTDASRTMPWLHRGAMGYTPGDNGRGRLTYVLINRVSALAIRYRIQRSVVLGVAIAHELGHMLLEDGHSATGIMKPDMDQNDFHQGGNRALIFNDEQGRRLACRARRLLNP
jgi:hypothetical protein